MILKSLEMENIRSYEEQKVTFPLGTTLFEGDIGSGKSTILNAIEFALFGLGSQRGASLLRLGTKKGSTTLTFGVDDKEYKIHRSLVRKGKKSVVQGDDGYIEAEGKRLSLSATELKERILDILNFNEPPDPKAQSVIYRYAVFTPQEEMKEILIQDPDKRLQTLRKAFGIEDYKIASENAQNTARVIKQQAKFFEGQISDLDRKKDLLERTKADIAKSNELLSDLRQKEKGLAEQLRIVSEQLDKFQDERLRMESIKSQIPGYQREIKDKTERIDRLKKDNDGLSSKITENKPTIDGLSELKPPTDKSRSELDADLKKAREKEKELGRDFAQTDAKLNDYTSIEEKGICPTCDRPADPKEFKLKIKEKTEAKEELSGLIKKQEALVKELDDLESKLRDYEDAQKELKILTSLVSDWEGRIKKNEEEIEKLDGEVEEANKKLASSVKAEKDYEAISTKIGALEKERDGIDEELKSVRKDINTNLGSIKTLEGNVKTLDDEIKKKKEQKMKKDKLTDHQVWLSEYFVPTLDLIERQVMISINQGFNQQFRRCFGTLIEDPDLEVKIDEDFTPIVEREGYDQDLVSLSGGEKTSVALAYRLALNTIVQKVSTGMKSNLLILDEPTDGFSKEQLFKVRDILTELKCPQVIIVSHERELESFADTICRVEKTGGISKVNLS
jgi:exonuclease SbcC